MFKKFWFWIVFVLAASIGSVVYIHWETLQTLRRHTAELQPLYQRQKRLSALSLTLERYRRASSGFRKLLPEEMLDVKTQLRNTFTESIAALDQLEPTSEELEKTHQLSDQLNELLTVSAQLERMLFTKDAYQKAEVVSLHEALLKNLEGLDSSVQTRLSALELGSQHAETQSLMLLLGVGGLIFALMVITLVRSYWIYDRPLHRLTQYASLFRSGQRALDSEAEAAYSFSGRFAEIQTVINALAQAVETHVKSRHKFIQDVVVDLRAPLRHFAGIQRGLSAPLSDDPLRRSLALFEGSLEDLSDLVELNHMESRLHSETADFSELVSGVCRALLPAHQAGRIQLLVPPLPVWVRVDAARMQRVIVQLLSKVLGALPEEGRVLVTLSHQQDLTSSSRASAGGLELLIQDGDPVWSQRPQGVGPEQDILKHWISDQGVCMAVAHKLIRFYGGSLTASGVMGSRLSLLLRLPEQVILSPGLILPPEQTLAEAGPQALALQGSVPSKPLPQAPAPLTSGEGFPISKTALARGEKIRSQGGTRSR